MVFFHKLRGDYHKAILEASDRMSPPLLFSFSHNGLVTFEAMHQKRKEVVDCYAIGYNLAVQHLSPITYLRLSIGTFDLSGCSSHLFFSMAVIEFPPRCDS